MAEEFSPEEKLLRLIRGDKKQKDKPSPEKAGLSQGPAEPPSTEIKSRKGESRTTPLITGEWRYLKFINSGLIIILIGTVVFFIFDLVSSNLKHPALISNRESKISNLELQPGASELQSASGEAKAAPFSTYAETIGSRELFKPQQPAVRLGTGAGVQTESAHDKLKDLSLIGIIAGEKPQAAIEDKKIQKTYFLYKGQMLNQMRVEEILEDRVILDFEGEKLELTL